MKMIAYLPMRPPGTQSYLDDPGSYGLNLVQTAARRIQSDIVYLDNDLSWETPHAIAGADLVHLECTFNQTFELALFLARQMGKPTCISLPIDRAASDIKLNDSLELLCLTDCLISPSEASVSHLATRRPVHVIRGGISSDWISHSSSSNQRNGVVCLARWCSDFECEQLIRELSSDIPLVICGRADRRRMLHRLRGRLSGHRVRFLPSPTRQQLRHLYLRSKSVLYPAFATTATASHVTPPANGGFALLEAMACGTPVICPSLGGWREFIRDGETGFLVNSMNEMIARTHSLASLNTVVERVGWNSSQVVGREFTAAIGGEKLATIYRKLLNAPQTSKARKVA